MRTFGLIGKKLGHSFSKKYFTEKFAKEGIENAQYELFELPEIEEVSTLFSQTSNLSGLNVTIPYKQAIIPYLDGLDQTAEKVGAVNVVKFTQDGKKIGYNSDLIGFARSFEAFCPDLAGKQALVLGNGGAAKAVCVALSDWNVPYKLVSRSPQEGLLTYNDLSAEVLSGYAIIINTTPLGMHPDVDSSPLLPYDALSEEHYLYDLVYNPEVTAFMAQGQAKGAKAKNGLEMLHLQAEAAWEIWNS